MTIYEQLMISDDLSSVTLSRKANKNCNTIRFRTTRVCVF